MTQQNNEQEYVSHYGLHPIYPRQEYFIIMETSSQFHAMRVVSSHTLALQQVEELKETGRYDNVYLTQQIGAKA